MKKHIMSICECGNYNDNYGDGWKKSDHLHRWIIHEVRREKFCGTDLLEEKCPLCEEKKDD
jgi:hypothetical protein